MMQGYDRIDASEATLHDMDKTTRAKPQQELCKVQTVCMIPRPVCTYSYYS